VDAALAQGDALPPADDPDAGGPGAAWLLGRAADAGTVWGGEHTGEMLVRWERELPERMRAIVLPAARGLGAIVESAQQRARRAGQRVGRFELVERLGGGGMGEVWKARRGSQLVALKMPHADASAADRTAMADALRRESGRLERLYVAKVATFIEAGVDGDTPYLATGYLRGRTLAEHALAHESSRMRLALLKRIARDACTGLANLHELGIVHRDVTPRNVFLRFRGHDPSPMPALDADPDGRRIDEAVLIDLGIAQPVGEEATSHLSLGYVAPEILANAPVGPAADVYALAATIAHVATRHRFAAGLPASAAAAWHVTTAPFDDPSVRAASEGLPPRLIALLADATALDPRQRPTLEAFDATLAEI
jgi:serine/threonine protein kinase